MIRPLALALSVVLLLAGSAAHAQSAAGGSLRDAAASAPVDLDKVVPETYRAGVTRLRDGELLKIDGRLGEAAWERAQRHGRFIQRDPDAGSFASQTTEFSVAYDDKVLYFAVWCFDTEYRGISASELKRDASLKKGDQVKIIIDPFRDKRNGFFFSTNPLGALKDAQHIDNGRSVNMDWNAVWDVKTTVDEHGWYAEIAIPLSQLRFKGGPGPQEWGLNVSRIVIRRNEDSYWVPFPRQWGTPGFSRMSSAGVLAGLTDLTARRRFEVVPYLSPRVSRAASTPDASTDMRAGFDLRVGLTSTMNADVTYKTDFAQVEADEETVNLSRFNLMFPEKRQFFSEPAGLFGYGAASEREPNVGPTGPQEPGLLQLYYSRRVGQAEGADVPILAGARVTGRTGAYQVGVMDVQTQATDLTSNGTTTAVDAANFAVVRVKRDLFRQSSIGAIFLNREGGSATAYNRTAGVDLNLAIGKRLLMTGLIGKTFTPGVSGADVAMAFDALYKTDRWNSGASYVDIPEHFNAEMGFIRRTDIRNLKGKLGWTPRPGWTGVRQLGFTGTGEAFHDHRGLMISRRGTGDFTATFDDSSMLQVTFLSDYDRLKTPWGPGPIVFPAGEYEWLTTKASYSSDQSKRVSGSVGIETGGYYGGDKRTYKITANLIPYRTLLVETTCQRNRVDAPLSARYVTTTVANRITYSFSPALFVKSFVQYNSDRRLATANLLLWYIYRPGSDLYVVYNHGWDTDLPEEPFVRTRNRSLSVKLTWWWSR